MTSELRVADLPLDWAQYSILVVDDEPGMRSFLARSLLARCNQVETVGSVEAAENLLLRQRFDLIILDITLPENRALPGCRNCAIRGSRVT